MKHIIFAGGTGTRFWPASRKDSPKQFQSVIEEKPLVRVKYEYLTKGYNPEDIFLSTGAKYENEVRKMLPELPNENFIFEPSMRDTGPAVALAVAYVNKLFPDEVVSTQWADHYIKNPDIFINTLRASEEYVLSEDKIVIIGLPPRFPSPHLGHIKYGKQLKIIDNAGKIKLNEFVRFVEKPTLEVAMQYVKSGDYSWNPGYFVSKPEMILDKYKKYAPEMYSAIMKMSDSDFSDESLSEFNNLEKISFDYVVAENLESEEALVMNAEMGWSDVGTWIALHETLADNNGQLVTQGNVTDVGSKGTLVYNYQPKELVATMNLKDMVVVNTKDVVAIFHKNDNAKIKAFLKKLEEEGKTEYL